MILLYTSLQHSFLQKEQIKNKIKEKEKQKEESLYIYFTTILCNVVFIRILIQLIWSMRIKSDICNEMFFSLFFFSYYSLSFPRWTSISIVLKIHCLYYFLFMIELKQLILFLIFLCSFHFTFILFHLFVKNTLSFIPFFLSFFFLSIYFWYIWMHSIKKEKKTVAMN